MSVELSCRFLNGAEKTVRKDICRTLVKFFKGDVIRQISSLMMENMLLQYQVVSKYEVVVRFIKAVYDFRWLRSKAEDLVRNTIYIGNGDDHQTKVQRVFGAAEFWAGKSLETTFVPLYV